MDTDATRVQRVPDVVGDTRFGSRATGMASRERQRPPGVGTRRRAAGECDTGRDGTRLGQDEIAELFEVYARTRDPALRAKLVEIHRRFSSSLAARFSTRHEAADELNQAALVGLLHAIDRFEPGRGVRFTTFAWATITGELKRHFRDRTWGMRVPRRLQELYLSTAEAVDELTHELGRSPTVTELSDHTGLDETEVVEAIEARTAYRLTSIDAPVGDDEGGMQLGGAEPGYAVVEQHDAVNQLIGRLPAREREIVRLRFVDELTQADIASRIGISQMHVSRLLAASLEKLRGWYEEN